MPKRSHNWLTFTSETLANRTNSRRCVMQVLSFQGIGYPPRLRTIVDSESVTYVSERLLPMCPVCTTFRAVGALLMYSGCSALNLPFVFSQIQSPFVF